MTKLDPSKIEEIIDHFSLHEPLEAEEVKSEESQEEEKPCLPATSAELTKSKFLSLFNEELQTIAARGHPPSHLEGRVGEAKNPGPDLFGEDEVLPN